MVRNSNRHKNRNKQSSWGLSSLAKHMQADYIADFESTRKKYLWKREPAEAGHGLHETALANTSDNAILRSTSTSTRDQGLENVTCLKHCLYSLLGTKYPCPSGASSGRRPAVMLNCRGWLISFGSARPASRSDLHLTNSSSAAPSLTCLFPRCSPTVVYGRGCLLRVAGG